MASIFSLFGTVYLDSEKAEKGIKDIKDKGADLDSSLGQKFSNIAGNAVKIGTAVIGAAAAVGGAATAMVTSFADTTGAIDDAAQRAGTSAEEYQKWTYAAKMSGIESEKLEQLMIKQQKSFADATDGSKVASEAYKTLGIDISNLTAGDAFNQAIDALASMDDETQRNALANDLFGKSYADLAPLLNSGAEGIAALKEEASAMGGVISNEAVASGAELGDSIDKIKTAFSGMVNGLMVEALPVIQQLIGMVIDNLPMIQGLISQLAPVLVDVFSKLMPPLLQLVQMLFPVIINLINMLVPIIIQLFDALMPVITAIIDYVIPPLIQMIEEILPILMPILVTLASIVSTVLTAAFQGLGAIVGGLTVIFKNVFGGLIEIVKAPLNWMIEKLNEFIRGLNGIKIPNWVPVVGGKSLNLPELKPLKIGLDYVPYDEYPALLHKGERVLTAEENKPGYSNASIDYDLLADKIAQSLANVNIILDKEQVGEFVDSRILKGAY